VPLTDEGPYPRCTSELPRARWWTQFEAVVVVLIASMIAAEVQYHACLTGKLHSHINPQSGRFVVFKGRRLLCFSDLMTETLRARKSQRPKAVRVTVLHDPLVERSI